MNMKLGFDFNKILPFLAKSERYIVGLILIGIFGVTAYFINAALNVAPAAAPSTKSVTKITFDEKTITTVKNLPASSAEVPPTIGQRNPFVP